MNCCNELGKCELGLGCPVRPTAIQPEDATLHAAAQHQTELRTAGTAGALHADWRHSIAFGVIPTHEQQHSCHELGMCQGRADCECVDGLELHSPLSASAASAIPHEAGNVWFVPSDLSPPKEVGRVSHPPTPLTLKEKGFVGFLATSTLAWVAALAFGIGYGWTRWGSSVSSTVSSLGNYLLNHAAAWGLPG